jgi:hypothetical protein
MKLKDQINAEFTRVLPLGVSSDTPQQLTINVPTGRLECELTELDKLACSFQSFVFRNDQLAGKTVDELKRRSGPQRMRRPDAFQPAPKRRRRHQLLRTPRQAQPALALPLQQTPRQRTPSDPRPCHARSVSTIGERFCHGLKLLVLAPVSIPPTAGGLGRGNDW